MRSAARRPTRRPTVDFVASTVTSDAVDEEQAALSTAMGSELVSSVLTIPSTAKDWAALRRRARSVAEAVVGRGRAG